MRGITVVLLCCSAFLGSACNAIVGVEDVKQKNNLLTRNDKDDDDDLSGDNDDDRGGRAPKGGPVKAEDDEPQGGSKGGSAKECNGAPGCERLAFVTKETFSGNLGGLAGADQKCFDAAKAIPGFKGRAFRAWLSDSMASAKARLPKGTGTYRRIDDSVVATSFADLLDGDVNLPIALDQDGEMLPSSNLERSVWTGTTADGAASELNCRDWTSDDIMQSGTYGDSQATDSTWTESGTSSCNAPRHLYCVEY